MSHILSVTGLMDIMAILILVSMLCYVLRKRGAPSLPDKIFIIMLCIDLVAAILDITLRTLRSSYPFDSAAVPQLLKTLFLLATHTCCYLLLIYVMHITGHEKLIKGRSLICAIPLFAESVMLLLNLPYDFLFSYNTVSGRFVYADVFTFSMFSAFLYIGAIMVVFARYDPVLTVFPAAFILLRVYFNIVLHEASPTALFLALCLAILYFSVIRRGLIIQLGGTILLLCIITTFIIGNIVTTASFNSYLRTIHDRNYSHMNDVLEYMKSFKALPWLMQYWSENPDMVSVPEHDPDGEFYDMNDANLGSITEEAVRLYSPGRQRSFARACYMRIAAYYEKELDVHDLDDLFMIIPDGPDTALIIFDAKLNGDGTYRLGDHRDLKEEEEEWNNYDNAINNQDSWVWGRYTPEDDFGFFRELPFGNDGARALLCNSFKRSELYEHLDFIASFRLRAMGYMVVMAAVIMIVLFAMILRPVSVISKTIKKYEKNKDPEEVERDLSAIREYNEIGAFAKEFSNLAWEMDRHTAQLVSYAEENERVNTELRMARDIQSSVLPVASSDFGSRRDFDISASIRPARSVSGDFYDFFFADDDHLVFLIADVSDKGIPAALFMMSVKNLINFCTHGGSTPATVLSEVNSRLCVKNPTLMFVTVWMGMLELSTGRLLYVDAGHERAAIRRPGGGFSLCEEASHKCALGIRKNMEYVDNELYLGNGDMVFLYTDGVTEAKDENGKFFGSTKMTAALNTARVGSPEVLITDMQEALAAYSKGAEQFDDITMLCLRFNRVI